MSNTELYPSDFFKYFDDICKIPRASGNEGGMVRYLTEFARRNGLEYYADEHNNVLIKKPAGLGYESCSALAFQGHTDMVCQKLPDSKHDFLTEPIEYRIEGGKMTANGTTLGADDGAAVCLMLSFLADDEMSHPPLECLFTAEEETGLCGAKGFDYTHLTSRLLINLDGEEEYNVLSSCAGGVKLYSERKFPLSESSGVCLKITLDGLYGGHSGADIDKGRMNANAKLISLLDYLYKKYSVRLAEFDGGSVDNAIASRAYCVVCTDKENEVTSFCKKFERVLKDIAVKDDAGLFIRCERCNSVPSLSASDTYDAIYAIHGMKSGIMTMSQDIKGLVQTSANVGVLKLEGGLLTCHTSIRSSIESEREKLYSHNEASAKKHGLTVKRVGEYPGWVFKKHSPLRELYCQCFAQTHNGKRPDICAIHAGLECGIISKHLLACDIISIGPEMSDVHSPTESLDIASVGRVYDTLKLLMQSLKEQKI